MHEPLCLISWRISCVIDEQCAKRDRGKTIYFSFILNVFKGNDFNYMLGKKVWAEIVKAFSSDRKKSGAEN